MIPLSMVRNGWVKVMSINGGRVLRERLRIMGLRENSVILVTSSSPFGPIIVRIGETRIGIGAGMASKIIVKPFGGD